MNANEMSSFFENMGMMIKAGITPSEAVDLLRQLLEVVREARVQVEALDAHAALDEVARGVVVDVLVDAALERRRQRCQVDPLGQEPGLEHLFVVYTLSLRSVIRRW